MLEKAEMMIPISSLNALVYCPRKFYYQFVQGEEMSNEFILEGTLAHQQVDQTGMQMTTEGIRQMTHLYLASETLHLTGFADVVEERGGVLIPVEYKHGQQGHWLNDHVQLCAQALCLEERQPGKAPLAYGYIFALGSRRGCRWHSRHNCEPGREKRLCRRFRWQPWRHHLHRSQANWRFAVPIVASCPSACRRKYDCCKPTRKDEVGEPTRLVSLQTRCFIKKSDEASFFSQEGDFRCQPST